MCVGVHPLPARCVQPTALNGCWSWHGNLEGATHILCRPLALSSCLMSFSVWFRAASATGTRKSASAQGCLRRSPLTYLSALCSPCSAMAYGVWVCPLLGLREGDVLGRSLGGVYSRTILILLSFGPRLDPPRCSFAVRQAISIANLWLAMGQRICRQRHCLLMWHSESWHRRETCAGVLFVLALLCGGRCVSVTMISIAGHRSELVVQPQRSMSFPRAALG